MAKKNGAPTLRFVMAPPQCRQATSPGSGGALDADDHRANQILAMAQARERHADEMDDHQRQHAMGEQPSGTCCMTVEPQKASVVSSQPLTAVAAIAASRTTIIAPPAGLWPMYRRSDPSLIARR